MKLLCLSNGHGEDTIALRILQELQIQSATDPEANLEIAALPIVGAGHAYIDQGIPLAGPAKPMPSGGFIYMDRQQLLRDLKGGLLSLTRAQLQIVRSRAKAGWQILAVGDIVPLLFAWWSGATYAFVGTAKTEYYLRDEQGRLPRQSWWNRLEGWSGSDYLPWERWLMRHRRCRVVFPRDLLTANTLKRWGIPAISMGNPMMDGLEPTGIELDIQENSSTDEVSTPPLAFVLLPGSRSPEAHANWQMMLQAVSALVSSFGNKQRLLFLGAIAPRLDLAPFLQDLKASGWWITSSPRVSPSLRVFQQLGATLILTQQAYSDCLHRADFAIAMAGTATEQFVGLGKPAITLPGQGPQFTPKFAEAQTRLLGPSVTLVDHPTAVVAAVQSLLNDPDRLQEIAENGYRRMGQPGAAHRIAEYLRSVF